MRTLPRAVVAASLIVGCAIAPATAEPAATSDQTAAAVAQIEERVYVETTVDTDGNGRKDRVAIDIARPDTGGRVPVVFEHSPYVKGTNNAPFHNVNVDRLPQEGLFGALSTESASPSPRPAPDLPGWYDGYFVPRGYAVVMGHSIGTGDSEGCPTSGDRNETLGTTAVVDWLNGRAKGYNAAGTEVTASWSTGNVGMIGISYNGTLPNAAASTGVAGLKAIVPIAAISSWYDYYRANGLVVAPGGYQGEDADVLANAVVGRTGCADEIATLTANQDRVTGDRTPFWQNRDYLRDADKVRAAVFVMHGQSDWNVKGQHYAQWWDALRRNNVPRKIWLHNGGHGAPSRSDYQATVLKWFDHHLKGIDNGIMTEPMADVQLADGQWRQYGDWPDPAARNAVFNLGATSATAPGTLSLAGSGGSTQQSFTDQGRTKTAATLAASPDSANAARLVYRSEALTSSLRLSGVPSVSLRTSVLNRKDANVTALLVDYGGTTPVIVTRGWIDPQNRNGAATGEAVVQGQDYDLRFTMQPKDYVFAAGRRIGLVVISTDYDYTLRPTAGTTLRVSPAQSTLTVPLVGLAGDDLSVALSPASGSVERGGALTSTVSTAVTSGGAQVVTLSAAGLPAGATASFAPASVTTGGSSTMTIATSTSTPAGTYQVTVAATGAQVTRTATYSLTVTAPGGSCSGSNVTPVTIPDLTTVQSSITIAGCTATPGTASVVDVNITHTYQGDLVVDLLAPDGSVYTLHNRTGGSADNIVRTYQVNLSGEAPNGAWKLRVRDAASGDVGRIERWSLNLAG